MKKKFWRWSFGGGCVLLGLVLLYWVKPILGPFIAAFILAYLLNPLVEELEKRRLGRKTSIALVFIGIIAMIALTLFLILPVLYNELSKLSQIFPQVVDSLNQQLQSLRNQLSTTGLPGQVVKALDEQMIHGQTYIESTLDNFLDHLPQRLGSLSLYVLAPVMAVYFLADWRRMERWFLRVAPGRFRIEWQRLWQDVNHVLRRFIRGNLVVAVIVGVLIGMGVKLIGMDYALLIGVICGIFDLIPYFGPLIGAIPSVLLGLTHSPLMAVEVAIVIFVVQQLEGGFISPKLMGDSVGLHPLWVVFALLAGERIAGFWGMLFAVPFAAVLRVLIRQAYFHLVAPEREPINSGDSG